MAHTQLARLAAMIIAVAVCTGGFQAYGMVPSLPGVHSETGAKAGDFRIWPRFSLEGGYDTNVFYAAEGDNYQKVGSPFMLLSPGIRLENPDGKDFVMMFDGAGAFKRYFSGDETVDDPQSNFGADALFSLRFFPRRAASLELYDSLTHRLETPNFSTTKTFNRLVNTAGAKARLHPGGVGGRRALEFAAGYDYRIEKFVDFGSLDQDQHTFDFLATWKFFPKTALFGNANFALRSWDTEAVEFGRTNSKPLRFFAGLTGFISNKVSSTLKLGYGGGNYDQGQDFSGVLGEATISYMPVRSTVLSVGYKRDFRDSLYSNFYGMDRVSLTGKQQFLGRVNLKTEFAYTLIDYGFFDPSATEVAGGTFNVVNTTDRQDAAFDVNSSMEFELSRFFAFQLSYNYREVFSEFEERNSADGVLSEDDTVIDVGGYSRHLILGGVRLQY